MGKNYTLYINIESFASEANKSGLVNRLLREHYASSYGGKKISKPLPKIPGVTTASKITYQKKGTWGA